MRYVLRNQIKIEKSLGKIMLHRINESLKDHFETAKKLDCIRCHGDKFDTLLINDAHHTSNIIAFYVIRKVFGSHMLAFKEFIG